MRGLRTRQGITVDLIWSEGTLTGLVLRSSRPVNVALIYGVLSLRLKMAGGEEIRCEGVEEAILGGCSVGSGISLLLGLDHPEMFKALILVGGNSKGSASAQKRIDGFTKTGVKKYHRPYIEELVAPGFPRTKLGDYLLDIFIGRGPWLSGESIGQIFRARSGTDMTPRLGSLKVPTLVINGEHDNSLRSGRETASLIPGAIHKVLPKTGHACCIEDPAGFDAFVVEFLQSQGLMLS